MRDLIAAGIRDLAAPGVTLHDSTLRYDRTWPARWSYARTEPLEGSTARRSRRL